MNPISFGKYLLVDQIAVGGMAEIYKAIAQDTEGKKHLIAVKRILPQYSNDEEFISMMIDEAKVMVLLNHPNIVPIVEFGKLEGSYYIAMEYVHGTTLKDIFKKVRTKKQTFSIDLAVHIVREIGTGLSYAHRKVDESGTPLQIVHRDISPANILVSFDGEIRIADFGISKASNQSHRTQIGIIRGKTGYMSPEQTRANTPIDQRSDIFALGVILWELLSGDRLFQAETVPEALKLVRETKVPPIRQVRPEVPQELENIMLRALAQLPDSRFQRAENLVDALNEFLTRWTPKGRPSRVTHNDLVGFLHRFFAPEMAEPAFDPATVIYDDGKTHADTHHSLTPTLSPDSMGPESTTATTRTTRPQTFAANPLYELSAPEFSLTAGATQPTAKTTISTVSTRLGAPSESVPISDGPTESSKGRSLYVMAGVSLIALATVGILLKWSGRKNESPPSVALHPSSTPTQVDTETRRNPDWLVVPVSSDPPGAKVFFSGRVMEGMTPLEIAGVEPDKTYSIRIEKRGYKPLEKTLRRSQGDQSSQIYTLERIGSDDSPVSPPKVGTPVKLGPLPKFATLSIQTSPWSSVFINDKKVDDTPLVNVSMPEGKHRIRLVPPRETKELKPYDFILPIKGGQNVKCSFNFVKRDKPRCEWQK